MTYMISKVFTTSVFASEPVMSGMQAVEKLLRVWRRKDLEHRVAEQKVSRVETSAAGVRDALFAAGANAVVAVRRGAVQAENSALLFSPVRNALHVEEIPAGMTLLADAWDEAGAAVDLGAAAPDFVLDAEAEPADPVLEFGLVAA
jgi:hypothetical protein